MNSFVVNILGCGSATPTFRHHQSSQIIDYRGNLFMIDCGEYAQMQALRMKLKLGRIAHVFISHMHGDHVLGLPALLSTLDLKQKSGKIVIHVLNDGIKILKAITNYFCKNSSFEIIFEPIAPSGGVVFENKSLIVKAFPLSHSLPCVGFLFQEKPKLRHLKGDMIKFYNIPISALADIKSGKDYVTPDGKVISNDRLTNPPDECRSYAYCSDTRFLPSLSETLKGVTTIYHEATYDATYKEKARIRGHSTAEDAAIIAKNASAEKLIIGHFSSNYPNEKLHEEQAKKIFGDNVIVANEGMKIEV